MCYVLYVASPLTLSEVRSMLPAGLTAHALSPDDERRLRRDFRPARTIASLLVGPCSCDFLLQRDPVTHREEAALRARYAQLALPRAAVIRALDRHRAGPADPVEPPGIRRRALVAFVAEHARNAGPTTYWLRFSPEGAAESPPDPPPARTVLLAGVCAAPDDWLAEGEPLRIVR